MGSASTSGFWCRIYEVDRKFWLDDHFDGGHLFREKINLEAVPAVETEGWKLRYGLDSRTPNRATTEAEARRENGKVVFRIPLEQKTRPGLKAQLVLEARPWN